MFPGVGCLNGLRHVQLKRSSAISLLPERPALSYRLPHNRYEVHFNVERWGTPDSGHNVYALQ